MTEKKTENEKREKGELNMKKGEFKKRGKVELKIKKDTKGNGK